MQRFLATSRAARSVRDVRWAYKLMDKYDCVEYARDCARELAAGAQEEFELAYADAPPGDDRRFVEQIVDYMVEREL